MADIKQIRRAHASARPKATDNPAWANCHRDLGVALDFIQSLQACVAIQAEDEGLWFVAETAPEAYLQQALRRLHEAIEGKTPEECAEELYDGRVEPWD
jgi:hypothetical protein